MILRQQYFAKYFGTTTIPSHSSSCKIALQIWACIHTGYMTTVCAHFSFSREHTKSDLDSIAHQGYYHINTIHSILFSVGISMDICISLLGIQLPPLSLHTTRSSLQHLVFDWSLLISIGAPQSRPTWNGKFFYPIVSPTRHTLKIVCRPPAPIVMWFAQRLDCPAY